MWLLYKKLYIFHVNLMSLEVSIHLWNPHHHLWPHKPIHHFQNVLLPLIYDANHNENSEKSYLPRKTLGLRYSVVNSRLLELQDFTRLVQLPRHLDGAPSYTASWVTVNRENANWNTDCACSVCVRFLSWVEFTLTMERLSSEKYPFHVLFVIFRNFLSCLNPLVNKKKMDFS